MDTNLFHSYLKILDVPFDYRDLDKNHKLRFDINRNLAQHIDGEELVHYYFIPGTFLSKELAIESHNQRVPEWNVNHPEYQIKKLNGQELDLYPIRIQNNLIFNIELFDLMEKNGTKYLTRRLNKSALIYFQENIHLSNKYKISPQLENKIKNSITKIKEWFVVNNIDPDEVESLLDINNDMRFTTKIESLFEENDNANVLELGKSQPITSITKNEAFNLLKYLEDNQYKMTKSDNLIINNKSFSHWSSTYIKKRFNQNFLDEAFEELKVNGKLEYNKFVHLTNPPSKWYENKFINIFIHHCIHPNGRYIEKIINQKFEANKSVVIDNNRKKCFLLIKT